MSGGIQLALAVYGAIRMAQDIVALLSVLFGGQP
jgi:hypothetical protein